MTLVVKVESNGDIRRFTSTGPASYEGILEQVSVAWPQEMAAGACLKYRDDEGDLCTLMPGTMEDLLELQPAGAAHSRVLKLVLVPPATPAAPAAPGLPPVSLAPSLVESNEAAAAAARPPSPVPGPSAPLQPSAPPAPSAPPFSPWPAPQLHPSPQLPPWVAHVCEFARTAGFSAQLPACVQQPIVVVHNGSAVDVTLKWNIWSAWPEGAGAVGVSLQVEVVPWVPGAELQLQLPADTDVRNLWSAELESRTPNGIFTIRLAPYPTSSFGGTFGYRNTDVGSVTQRLLGALRQG